MSFRDALDGLAALDAAGINHNYGPESLPESIPRAVLPVLLVAPLDGPEAGLFRERGGAYQAEAFSGGPGTMTCVVRHLLLAAPTGAGAGLRSHLPGLIELIDAYIAALAQDPLLGGALLEPPRVRVEPGIIEYGRAAYYGCVFRHELLIGV